MWSRCYGSRCWSATTMYMSRCFKSVLVGSLAVQVWSRYLSHSSDRQRNFVNVIGMLRVTVLDGNNIVIAKVLQVTVLVGA